MKAYICMFLYIDVRASVYMCMCLHVCVCRCVRVCTRVYVLYVYQSTLYTSPFM